MGAYEGYQYIKLKSGELTYGCIYKLINTKQKVLEHYKNLAAVLITKKDVDYTFLDFIETWESDGWIFDFDDNELREIVFIANKIYIAICSNKEEIAKTITWIQ